ncbi:hypothetical protein SDC9_167046 [bioreactor metagenome]|uniref:Uncharacterized protein n=1 Tax=bioreactor metagenome TaxID=1076179 RepID=A0A645G6B9_9ZZZZ
MLTQKLQPERIQSGNTAGLFIFQDLPVKAFGNPADIGRVDDCEGRFHGLGIAYDDVFSFLFLRVDDDICPFLNNSGLLTGDFSDGVTEIIGVV